MKVILLTGVSIEQGKKSLSKLNELQGIFSDKLSLYLTAGIHPTEAGEFLKYVDSGAGIDDLRSFIQSNSSVVKAFGEYGLDKDRLQYCDYDQQLKVFEAQLKLNSSLMMPSFYHCRSAEDDFFSMITQYDKSHLNGGLVHSFTGTKDAVSLCKKMQLHISINGAGIRETDSLSVIRDIDTSMLLLETDSPWCIMKKTHASSPYLKDFDGIHAVKAFKSYETDKDTAYVIKGRNEPALLCQVAEAVYRIKHDYEGPLGDDFVSFCNKTYENTCKLFNFKTC